MEKALIVVLALHTLAFYVVLFLAVARLRRASAIDSAHGEALNEDALLMRVAKAYEKLVYDSRPTPVVSALEKLRLGEHISAVIVRGKEKRVIE